MSKGIDVLKRIEPGTMKQRWRVNIDDHVIDMAWSPDGRMLAAAAVGGPITVFDATTGEVRQTLPGHGFGTTEIGWAPDAGAGTSALLASAGQDGKARLWDVTTGAELHVLTCGAAWVEHLVWSPRANGPQAAAKVLRGKQTAPSAPTSASNGSAPVLLATAAGKKLRLWNTNGELVREYPDHPHTISDIAWLPGTGRVRAGLFNRSTPPAELTPILSSATYGSLSFWQPGDAELLGRYEWKGSILTIAWSPDGSYIATGDQDSTVHFWMAQTGLDLQMWGYPTKVRELAWDSGSRYLATGGGSAITIWDCSGKGPEGSRPIQLDLHDGLLTVLNYQHRGALLASGGEEGVVAIWQPAKSKRAIAQIGMNSPISQAEWSPDDRAVAVGSEAGTLAVFNSP